MMAKKAHSPSTAELLTEQLRKVYKPGATAEDYLRLIITSARSLRQGIGLPWKVIETAITDATGLFFSDRRSDPTLPQPEPHPQDQSSRILDDIALALESRGYAHFCNGDGIGKIVDELDAADANVARLSETVRQLRDALKPFAKAGELFPPQPPEAWDQLVYGPAAGDAYNITGNHLRAANRIFAETSAKSDDAG